jgi:Na+-translocating ferredoxin:NAD+ oxidoreductase RnfA subunit
MTHNDLAMLSCDNLALNFLSTKPTWKNGDFSKVAQNIAIKYSRCCAFVLYILSFVALYKLIVKIFAPLLFKCPQL